MGQLRPHPNTSELIACSAEPKTLRFVVLFEVPCSLWTRRNTGVFEAPRVDVNEGHTPVVDSR
jgi:hypothetical protein